MPTSTFPIGLLWFCMIFGFEAFPCLSYVVGGAYFSVYIHFITLDHCCQVTSSPRQIIVSSVNSSVTVSPVSFLSVRLYWPQQLIFPFDRLFNKSGNGRTCPYTVYVHV
jgi:hypothetical protein